MSAEKARKLPTASVALVAGYLVVFGFPLVRFVLSAFVMVVLPALARFRFVLVVFFVVPPVVVAAEGRRGFVRGTRRRRRRRRRDELDEFAGR
ncbi:MAG TPA: hypothetical protein VNN12_09575 [Dehalococcoidia bacterium]|nr:hypothetical protein [Dehalococcoidia bacterium]